MFVTVRLCYHCMYVCVAGSLCVITACMFVLQEVCALSLLVCLCYRKFVCYHCLYVCVAGSLCVITACMFVLQEVCVLSLLVCCLCYRKFVCYSVL